MTLWTSRMYCWNFEMAFSDTWTTVTRVLPRLSNKCYASNTRSSRRTQSQIELCQGILSTPECQPDREHLRTEAGESLRCLYRVHKLHFFTKIPLRSATHFRCERRSNLQNPSAARLSILSIQIATPTPLLCAYESSVEEERRQK